MDLSNAHLADFKEQARLQTLARLDILDTPAERDFDDLTRLAALALGVESAAISLIDRDRQWFKARHGIAVPETSREVAFCRHVVASGDMLVVPDASRDSRFATNPLVQGNPSIRFYVGMPIVVSDGHCVGTLCAFDPVPREGVSEQQRSVLADLASLITDLIESRRFRKMGEIAAKVVEGSSDAVLAGDPEGTIIYSNPSARAMFGLTGQEMLGNSIDTYLIPPSPGPTESFLERIISEAPAPNTGDFVEIQARRADGSLFTVEMSLSRWSDGSSEDGFAVVLRDLAGRKALERDREHARSFLDSVVSNLPAMLFVKDVASRQYRVVNEAGEKVIGRSAAEMLGSTDAELFPEYGTGYERRDSEAIAANGPHIFESAFVRDDGETVHLRTIRKLIDGPDRPGQYILGISEDVTQIRRKEAEILHLAHHDTLTGALNRASFNQRLQELVRGNDPFAMLSIDLDRFKAVNDMFGHPTGDAVLIEVATRLNAIVGEQGWLARIGGDEFFVILVGDGVREQAETIASTIIERLAQPFRHEQRVAHVGASIGIVVKPQDGLTCEQLRENVDIALYRAKSAGRSAACFFNAEMDAAARDRREIVRDLRRAVADGEITLAYQPVVATRTGEITSAEALARWIHRDRGPIAPDIFIPLAEECGLIDVLGEQLLRRACLDAQEWPGLIRVAVNLSPLQFLSEKLPSTVRSALEKSGLSPNRLQLEVTEGLVIRDVERTFEQLEQLRKLGIQILIDDFGVGYSSLSYFQRFTFDKVKIDKSFIDEIETSRAAKAVVQAVVGLGRQLGMGIVAEGVETQQQMRSLVALGCTHLQGYLFGRPMSAHSLATLHHAGLDSGVSTPALQIRSLGSASAGLLDGHRR